MVEAHDRDLVAKELKVEELVRDAGDRGESHDIRIRDAVMDLIRDLRSYRAGRGEEWRIDALNRWLGYLRVEFGEAIGFPTDETEEWLGSEEWLPVGGMEDAPSTVATISSSVASNGNGSNGRWLAAVDEMNFAIFDGLRSWADHDYRLRRRLVLSFGEQGRELLRTVRESLRTGARPARQADLWTDLIFDLFRKQAELIRGGLDDVAELRDETEAQIRAMLTTETDATQTAEPSAEWLRRPRRSSDVDAFEPERSRSIVE